MMDIIIPKEVIINFIEPYSRSIQNIELLEDIKSFHSTLEQVKDFYTNITYTNYNNDSYSYFFEPQSFYDDFAEGLNVISRIRSSKKINPYFATIACRLMWATLTHEQRIETFILLQSISRRFARRPGDPL